MRVTATLLLLLSLSPGLPMGAPAAASAIGGDFSLTDHQGRAFDLQQLRGKVVVLFFGYTFCPDICPTELAAVSRVLDGLGAEADQARGLFISLDPERDTPRVLKDYLGYFHRGLIGLTGSADQIRRVAERYRVRYRKHPLANGSYSVDHSANLFIIDQEGELFSIVPYGLPPEQVLRVIRSLLENRTPGER